MPLIDWVNHKRYIIEKGMERGTDEEKEVIREFYGSG
ncbi:DUF6922 domain-containing protein [Aquiflexum sp.]